MKKRLLFLVYFIIFIDSLGYGIVVPVMPVYARQLGIGQFALGMLFGSYALGIILGSVPFGLLSDRWGRQPFLFLSMLAMAGAFVVYAFSGSYVSLFLSRLVDGLTAAANWSVGLAILADITAADKRGSTMGWAITFMGAGSVIGPLLGGFSSDILGHRAPFLLVAGLCLLAAMATLTGGSLRDQDRPTNRAGFRRQVREALQRPRVALVLLVAMMGTASLGLLEPLFPVYLSENLGLSATVIGVLFALTVFSYTIASPAVGTWSDRRGKSRPMVLGLVGSAIAGPLLALSGNLLTAAVIFTFYGVVVALVEAPTMPLIADLIEEGDGDQSYGTAYGLFNMSYALGALLGPAVGGIIASGSSLFSAMLVLSLPLLFLAVKLWMARSDLG